MSDQEECYADTDVASNDVAGGGKRTLEGGSSSGNLCIYKPQELRVISHATADANDDNDDDDDAGDDNVSVEANYGDASSCCVSDVSSVSFQNVVLEDLSEGGGVAGVRLRIPIDRASNGSDVDVACDDFLHDETERRDDDDCDDESGKMKSDDDEIVDARKDDVDDEKKRDDDGDKKRDDDDDKKRDDDDDLRMNGGFKSAADVEQSISGVSVLRKVVDAALDDGAECGRNDPTVPATLEVDDPTTVDLPAEGKRRDRARGGNVDHKTQTKHVQQSLRSSPGLARRMLPTDDNDADETKTNETSPEDFETGADGKKTDAQKEKYEGDEEKEKSRHVTSCEFSDEEKREKIAHMDALYKKQIEAMMKNRSSGSAVVDLSEDGNTDIRNEYDYVKYTRKFTEGRETYFGMRLGRSQTSEDDGDETTTTTASDNVVGSASNHREDGRPSEKTNVDTHENNSVKLSLDGGDAVVGVSERTTECRMPSVEDGLSSGHASDADDNPATHDPSPSELLHSRQRSEVRSVQETDRRRPDSLSMMTTSSSEGTEGERKDGASDSRTRQNDVERAIQDIKTAIERSKKVKLVSPSGNDESTRCGASETGQEPVWITRKEQAKDHQSKVQFAQQPYEEVASSPKAQKGGGIASSLLDAKNVIHKNKKKYTSLPAYETPDDEDDGEDDDEEEEEEDDERGMDRRIPKTDPRQYRDLQDQDHSSGMTGNGYARAVGSEQHGPVGPPSPPSFLRDAAKLSSSYLDDGTRGSRRCDATTREKAEDEAKRLAPHDRLRDDERCPECDSNKRSRSAAGSSALRQVEGEYSTDEETDELLNKQYALNEKVDIPELFASPVNRTQNRQRLNRAREVAMRDPTNETVLIEGVLFRASYLGSTQLLSEGQPSKAMRMMQAQEAVGRIKAPDGETQPSTEVDLFVSVEKIMVLNTDLQEIMMDHALRTISYIADIGDILVIMARRGPVMGRTELDGTQRKNQTKICCHVFESDEAQLIAQSIGQAFQVSYMEFLKANGIENPSHLNELDYQEVLNQQEIFGEELYLFSNREMQKEIIVPKVKSEPLGVVIVESGWGSMVPTVVLANMSPTGAAARCGQLNIGDQIMSINGISLVGLPLSTCQNYIKAARNQSVVKVVVVSCAPVVEVLIKRPDIKYQLGFSVQNGVICSLLRGGIAERGGIRVGHRIIEINSQSVVAVSHDKIVHMLATSVGEIQMKTMPMSIFRLLTGQDVPHYI